MSRPGLYKLDHSEYLKHAIPFWPIEARMYNVLECKKSTLTHCLSEKSGNFERRRLGCHAFIRLDLRKQSGAASGSGTRIGKRGGVRMRRSANRHWHT